MKKTKPGAIPIVLLALLAIYIVALFKITIFKNGCLSAGSVNLIPFYTIFEYWQSVLTGNKIIGISNLFGNLILFAPLGFMTASLFPKMQNLIKILLLGFIFSLCIELVQYIFVRGAADIDDVILNVIGTAAGYGVYISSSRLFRTKKHAVLISIILIAVTCFGFYSFSNYKFLLPLPGFSQIESTGDNYNNNSVESNADSGDNTQSNSAQAQWYLILVNKWNPIPDGYEVELIKLSNGQSVDKRIYSALKKMLDAARSNGIYPVVVSGHRSTAEQQRLMDEKIAAFKADGYSSKDAAAKAEEWVSVPGTSEHQIGLAVDINADGVHSTGDEVYDWLNKNAYKYGFIRRYPPGKSEITGIAYEPWHYRYVGVEAATEIQDRSICLEEYLNEPVCGAGDGKSGQGRLKNLQA